MIESFEYVIVGSGVAATTISKKILEKKPDTTILLLEAGDKVIAKDRRYWWDYVTRPESPLPYQYTYDQEYENQSTGNIRWANKGGRVKAFGGSTMHWGGWSLRLKPEDFYLKTLTGRGADWPIDYDEMEPYYYEAEKFLSVSGDAGEMWDSEKIGYDPRKGKAYPLPPFEWTVTDGVMIQGFEKNKIKPGKMPIARYRKCMTTGTCKYCPLGSRFNAQYVLEDLLREYESLNVRTQSTALRVITSKKSKIEGIEYLERKTGNIRQVLGDKVILCAGAYEIPKLLMASASHQWEHGIGNDYDQLGRYVVTHSMLEVTGNADKNPYGWYQEYDFPTLMSRTLDNETEQPKGKLFLFRDRTLPKLDIAKEMISGKNKKEINKIIRGPMQFKLQAFMEEVGLFENRLSIGKGKDRFGLPLTKIVYNRNSIDQKNAENRLKILEDIVGEKGMGLKIGLKDKKIQTPRGDHTTGTCRMSEKPESGVTDKNLLVHGTENLYICSNGVFSSNSAVNPTLTLTTLAHRLAAHLNSQG